MKKLLSLSVILVLSLLGSILLVGCSSESNGATNGQGDPFTAQYTQGQYHMAIVTGNSTGHQSGETSQFILTLKNDDPQETWDGEYYMYLVDESSIIEEIHSDNFTVYHGSQHSWYLEPDFAGVTDGPYGLALVVPGQFEAVETIWIGPKTDEYISGWYQVSHSFSEANEQTSQKVAEDFLTTSPTFIFDGMPVTLAVKASSSQDQESGQFVFTFQSSHAGYGDREGEFVAQVVTPHEAVITVEQGVVTSAVMDGVWDMIGQQMLAVPEKDKSVGNDEDRQIAEDFIINSPTFSYDGIEGSLNLQGFAGWGSKTISENTSATNETYGFEYTFTFECSSAGYGDRTGQMTSQVITSHQAVITTENGVVVKAVLDGTWDMINQEQL